MGFFDFLWGKKKQNDDGGAAASGAIFPADSKDESDATESSTETSWADTFGVGDASSGGDGGGGDGGA